MAKRTRKTQSGLCQVFVSNVASMPVESIRFPLIVCTGIVGTDVVTHMFGTNIAVQSDYNHLGFWTIILGTRERPIYREDPD